MRQTMLRLFLMGLLLPATTSYAEVATLETSEWQAQLDTLQQRLAQSEASRQALSAQVAEQQLLVQRLQAEKQQLTQSLQHPPSDLAAPALNPQQLWFAIGAGSSIFSVLLGVFLARRRQPQRGIFH